MAQVRNGPLPSFRRLLVEGKRLAHRASAACQPRPPRHLTRRLPRKGTVPGCDGLSRSRAVGNLEAVIDVGDMHYAGVFLDPVDDPVGTAPSGVAAREGPEQRPEAPPSVLYQAQPHKPWIGSSGAKPENFIDHSAGRSTGGSGQRARTGAAQDGLVGHRRDPLFKRRATLLGVVCSVSVTERDEHIGSERARKLIVWHRIAHRRSCRTAPPESIWRAATARGGLP